MDLSGCAKWDPEDQLEGRKILREYADVSAKDDVNLGWTSVIKHKITLKVGANLIKECYRMVPPGLYEEVWKYLQEMIDIGAIWPSNSLWASAIVLVRKEWKTSFCINLRKLNSVTVKDAYSIPIIQDTVDCLQGAVWFTLLDLQSGYWKVELEVASKAYSLYGRPPWVMWVWANANLADENSRNVSAPYEDLFGTPAILMVYHISRWYHHLCSYPKRTFGKASQSAFIAKSCWTEVATCQVWLFKSQCDLFGTWNFKEWHPNWWS